MMTRWLKIAPILLLLAAACSDGLTETRRSGLAMDGPWVPDSEAVAQAESFDITFVSAGPWVGSSGCSGSFTAGGEALRQWVYDNWPQVTHVGGYACRAINGDSSTMSVHATGRALDINIPLDGTQADNDLGDPVANWLLEHAEEIGIQSIIWDRWIWSPSRSPRSRPYTGAHPHHNHIHVELTPAASKLETPWFQGPMGPPELGGCDTPLPAEGGVIDDSNTCFQAFGPAQYWRKVEGQGIDGGLRWTNAFQTDAPSNWARWRINLAEAGQYRVEYNHVSEFAVFSSARYGVKFGDETEEVYVDLGAGEDGWQPIGDFQFAAGAEQWVAVYDDFDGPVDDDQHVLADAIRLVRLDQEQPGADVVPDPTDNGEVSVDDPQDPVQFESDPEEGGGGSTVIRGEGACSTANGRGNWSWLSVFAVFLLRRRRD